MSEIVKTKIKANCYVEDVLDVNGKKKAKVLFDSDCNLIDDANDYLRESRIVSLTSYNSINAVARELCHFYNYLNQIDAKISNVDIDLIVNFIEYLKGVEKKRNRYAIENSISSIIEDNIEFTNVTKLFDNNKLSGIAIGKIINRAFLYLIYLHDEEKFNNTKFIKKIDVPKKRKRFLKRHGLVISSGSESEYENIEKKLISKEKIEMVKEAASSTNDYQRFLYLLLELTGLRSGEALGLKIYEANDNNIREVRGDIEYKDDSWIVKVVGGRDNPHDSLTKGNNSRTLLIAGQSKQEFEMVFERYLRFRNRKIKDDAREWIFINTKGNKLTHNTAYRRFKRLTERLLLSRTNNLSLHSYRHYFCTSELLRGTPLEFVAKLAGHSSPEITYKAYIHFGGEEMKELREKYESYYNKTRR